MNNKQQKNLNRQGSMLVLVAFVLVIFMIGAAICVDVAYMHMTRSELRTAVDAASRAGAATLIAEQDEAAAISSAIDIASRNQVASQGLTLSPGDVDVGTAELLANGRFEFASGGNQLNAVQVDGARTADSPDGPVGLFFGGLFGVNGFEPSESATSAGSVRDIALVLDRSGSMAARLGSGTRLSALQAAVRAFIREIESSSPNSNMSLTTYSTNSTRDLPLTPNLGTINAAVDQLIPRGWTNIAQGIRNGSLSLEQDRLNRRFADKTIVVMTDGVYNRGGNPTVAARFAANQGHVIHTITFSAGANQTIMQQVASIGGGRHIHADSASDLEAAFREIARTLAVVIIE